MMVNLSDPKLISVTAALLIREARILIARRPAGDRLAGFWEFPGGKLERGETPRTCLKRELAEEFLIQTQLGRFIGQTEHHYAHMAVRLLVYQARIKRGRVQPTVHDAIQWATPVQMRQFQFAPADRPIVKRLQTDPTCLEFTAQRG